MLQHIQEIEEQHKLTIQKLQHHVQEKEEVLAAEFAEAEQVYKTAEHDLREQLEEKTQIIEVILRFSVSIYLQKLILGLRVLKFTCNNMVLTQNTDNTMYVKIVQPIGLPKTLPQGSNMAC